MRHVTSIVVAILGFAALAPAQLRLHGSLGRHVQASVNVGARHVGQPILHQRGGDYHGGERQGRSRGRGRGRGRGGDRYDRGDRRGHGHASPARGHSHSYRIINERVWIPGYHKRVYVPAQYGWVYDSCGNRTWGVVRAACHERIWVPGRYEIRQRRVRC